MLVVTDLQFLEFSVEELKHGIHLIGKKGWESYPIIRENCFLISEKRCTPLGWVSPSTHILVSMILKFDLISTETMKK